MKLSDDAFLGVISAAPLVAIDLIVRNERGEVLLGRRRNRPAQDFWFVPGGRIFKNEGMRAALRRIARAELGVDLPPGRLLGAYDHFYPDNVFGVAALTTHYIALGYQIRLGSENVLTLDEQHAEVRWWSLESLLASDEVHQNTKMYFQEIVENGFGCDCDRPPG